MAEPISSHTTVRAPEPARLSSPEGAQSGPPLPTSPEGHIAQLNPTRNAALPRSIASGSRRRQRFLEVMGYAGPLGNAREARRELVQFVGFLVVALSEVVIIVALTAVAAVRDSLEPRSSGQTELAACSTLAAWNLVWVARLIVKSYLESWLFYRRRRARRARLRGEGQSPAPDALTSVSLYETAPDLSDVICPLTFQTFHILLFKLDPISTGIWIISAAIFIYQHGTRCLSVASVVSAATYTLLILVIAETFFVKVIPMVRTRRAQLRTSELEHKLSLAEVNRIPLVLYIPPPPDAVDVPPSPIAHLTRALSHPPLLPRPTPQVQTLNKRRFIFFRPGHGRNAYDMEREAAVASPVDDGDDWDRTFEPAPYPFVRLPENRATCSICLSDFEAPRRLNGWVAHKNGDGPEGEAYEMGQVTNPGRGALRRETEEVRVESPVLMDARAVQLADSESKDAPEPLRLLSCGHVFHKGCVDRWLTGEKALCPFCKQSVVVPRPPQSRRGRRRGTV